MGLSQRVNPGKFLFLSFCLLNTITKVVDPCSKEIVGGEVYETWECNKLMSNLKAHQLGLIQSGQAWLDLTIFLQPFRLWQETWVWSVGYGLSFPLSRLIAFGDKSCHVIWSFDILLLEKLLLDIAGLKSVSKSTLCHSLDRPLPSARRDDGRPIRRN